MALDRPTDFFTEHHIDISLDDISKDATYEVKISYKDSGTDLNSWEYVKKYKSKNKNVFRHTEPASLAHYRKKIIYCARSDAPLRPVEIAYFTALIKNRSVYLRLADVNDPTKIRIEGPYRHLEDFLKDRKRAFASITDIIQSLANQHLSKDNFIFMDDAYYSGALKKLSEETDLGKISDQHRWISDDNLSFLKDKSSEVLDLTWVPSDEFKKISESINHDKIKIIKLNAPNKQDLEEIFKLFPTVTTFEVPDATSEWVKNCLPTFRSYHHVILSNYGDIKPPPSCLEKFNRSIGVSYENALHLPAITLNKLTVKNPRHAGLYFTVQAGIELNSLHMEGCSNASFNLSELGTTYCGLKTPSILNDLTLVNCNNDSSLYIPTTNNIENLRIIDCNAFYFKAFDDTLYLDLDFCQLPHLRKLVVKNSNKNILKSTSFLGDTFQLTSCGFVDINPELEWIELDDPSNLDLTQFTSQRNILLADKTEPKEQVRNIKLRATDFADSRSIERFKRRYRNLESIEIIDANHDWVKNMLPLFPIGIAIILVNYKSSSLILPKGFRGNKLTIRKAKDLYSISALDDVRLKHFELMECFYKEKNEYELPEGLNCDLTNIPDLESLNFNNCEKTVTLLVSPKNNIHTLKASHCSLVKFEFLTHFINLKELVLRRVNSDFYTHCESPIPIFNEHRLERIEIEDVDLNKAIKDQSPPTHLKLNSFMRLQTAALGERFKADLPEDCVRTSLDTKPNSSIHKLTFEERPIESWTTRGERKTQPQDIDISRALYLETNFGYAPLLSDVSTAKNLETLIINDTYDLSYINSGQLPNLKKIQIKINRTEMFTSAPIINLTNCPALTELEIEIKNSQPITVNLTGCRALRKLNVNTHQDSIDLQGIQDCSNLRFARIHATNAFNYHKQFPEGCETDLVRTKSRSIPLRQRIANFVSLLSPLQWKILLAAVSGTTLTGLLTYLIISQWNSISDVVPPDVVPPDIVPPEVMPTPPQVIDPPPSLNDILNSIWESITHMASSIWDKIQTVLHYLWDGIQATPDFIYSTIKDIVFLFKDIIQGILHLSYSAISYTASFVWNSITAIPHLVYSSITNLAACIWSVIKAILFIPVNLVNLVIAHPLIIIIPAMGFLVYILYKNFGVHLSSAMERAWNQFRPAATSVPGTTQTEAIPTAPNLSNTKIPAPIVRSGKNKVSNFFSQSVTTTSTKNGKIEPAENLERLRKINAYHRYLAVFEEKTKKSELRSLKNDILESKESLTPLIELAAHQNPMQANKYLVRSLETEMQEGYSFENHLYIHSPEDLEEYFAPGKIENGEIKQETNGPLKKFMIDTGKPKVLVVNISNFTDQQRASFQSALDRPRPYLTLGSGDNTETIYLSDNIKVVCLIANDAPRGEAFQSRCKSWTLGSHVCVETKSVNETKYSSSEEKEYILSLDTDEKECLEIDLFNDPAWEEAILGEIIFEGQGAKLDKGPLFKAIVLKRPLMIYNLPDDEKLRLFIHRINDERKIILDNGQLVKIPEGVFIKVIDKPKNDLELTHIHIYSDQKQEEAVIKRRRIPLGIHNLHACYKQTILDEKNNAKTILGGLLDKYNPEEEVFYITTSIKESYWKKLLHEMKSRYPNKVFHFVLAPGASIENVAKRKILPIQNVKSEPESKRGLESKLSRTNNVHISNDPSYLAETLALQNKGLVIAVHPKTTFGDLFTEISLKSGGGFSDIQTSILKDLQDGKTIVLNGELSLTLYYQLLPLLLDSPHIYSNKGKRIDLPGRLICVMPAHMKERLSSIQIEEHLYDWNDYCQALAKDDHSKKLLKRIERFYHFADKIHPSRGDGRPEKAYKSYYRLARMLEALTQAEEKGTLHAHNPIKGIFLYDYPKDKGNYSDMVDYAYLNVISKYIFCPNDDTMARTNKLKKLKKVFNIQSDHDIESHAWHLLNCFSGKELVAILGTSLESAINFNGFPSLTSSALTNLKALFKEHTNAESKEEKSFSTKLPRHEKQQAEFKTLLKDKNVRLIILKGSPGAGKTYAVRQLFSQEETCYEGEDQFIEWLEKGGPFLWDEINMATESEISVLEALRSPDKRYRYINKAKGIDKEYILDKHLVLGTCNSESLPGRRFFNIIQDIGVTINVEEPSDEFLIEKILHPRLGEKYQQLANILIYAYHLIKQYNEFIPRSIRDIKGVTRRFLSLVKELENPSDLELKTVLLQACEGEFAGSIKDPLSRKKFINELRKKLNLAIVSEEKQEPSSLIQLTDDIFIPDTHRSFVTSIQQFLKMRLETLRARAREDKTDAPLDLQKQMLIVEGDPGLGKSTYLRAIVEHHKQEMKKLVLELKAKRELLLVKQTAGVRSTTEILALDKDIAVIEAEIVKDVQEISVGSADASSLLARVQAKEGIAIADEGNLDPDLAKTSNQLLCGVDEKRRPVDKRGFVYLRSQNSTAESGRPSGDPSDFNRADYMYIDTFTDHALKAFADRQNLPDSEQFVAAFREISKKRSWINIRTFHVVLKELAQNLKEEKAAHSVSTSEPPIQVDSGSGVGNLSSMWKTQPPTELLKENKLIPLMQN